MREALGEAGIGDDAIETRLDEVEAARRPLEWARDGDLVVLPVHELGARAKVVALLDTLRAGGWRPGMPLPQAPEPEPRPTQPATPRTFLPRPRSPNTGK